MAAAWQQLGEVQRANARIRAPPDPGRRRESTLQWTATAGTPDRSESVTGCLPVTHVAWHRGTWPASSTFRPEPAEPRNRLITTHRGNLGLRNPGLVDQRMDNLRRNRTLANRSDNRPLRDFTSLHTRPELSLGHAELVTQDGPPHAGTVRRSVRRTRNPRPQHPPIRQRQLIRHVVRDRAPTRISDQLPSLSLTVGGVIRPRGRRPAHRPPFTSQACRSASLLSSISCTNPQLSRWLGESRR
jgi:hypothetical protein